MPTTANPPKPRVAPSGMSRTASSKLGKTLFLALIPPPWISCLLPVPSCGSRCPSTTRSRSHHHHRHESQRSRPIGAHWLVEPHLFHLLYQVEIRSQPLGGGSGNGCCGSSHSAIVYNITIEFYQGTIFSGETQPAAPLKRRRSWCGLACCPAADPGRHADRACAPAGGRR